MSFGTGMGRSRLSRLIRDSWQLCGGVVGANEGGGGVGPIFTGIHVELVNMYCLANYDLCSVIHEECMCTYDGNNVTL